MKDVFVVIEKGEGKKSFWLKIGAAFENRDGSLTIRLDALPLTGTLQVREHQDRDQGQGARYQGGQQSRQQYQQRRAAPAPTDGSEFGGATDFDPPPDDGGQGNWG